MNVPRIIQVQPLDNLKIKALFENGEQKVLDLTPYLIKFPVFNKLKNKNLFKNVYVDCNGYAIAWNDEIDLSRYDVYEFGVWITKSPIRYIKDKAFL